MINLEFLVVALIIGRAVDWIFQTKYQAENKTHNVIELLEHSLWYATLTYFGVVLVTGTIFSMSIVFPALVISHIIIDNRFLVKLIMYVKGLTWVEVNSKKYAWLQIGIDQRLHDIVILLIALSI